MLRETGGWCKPRRATVHPHKPLCGHVIDFAVKVKRLMEHSGICLWRNGGDIARCGGTKSGGTGAQGEKGWELTGMGGASKALPKKKRRGKGQISRF